MGCDLNWPRAKWREMWVSSNYLSNISHSSPVPVGPWSRDPPETAGTSCFRRYWVPYFANPTRAHAHNKKPHCSTGLETGCNLSCSKCCVPVFFKFCLPGVANFFLDLSTFLFWYEPRDWDFDLRTMFLRLKITQLDGLLNCWLAKQKVKLQSGP